jgi:hypothetical protein
MEFPALDETYILLFNKSVSISGFTIRRMCTMEFETNIFGGSLLYRLYRLVEVCRKYPSAYFNTSITQLIEEEGVVLYFGNSDIGKMYTPGKVPTQNMWNRIAMGI